MLLVAAVLLCGRAELGVPGTVLPRKPELLPGLAAALGPARPMLLDALAADPAAAAGLLLAVAGRGGDESPGRALWSSRLPDDVAGEVGRSQLAPALLHLHLRRADHRTVSAILIELEGVLGRDELRLLSVWARAALPETASGDPPGPG